MSVHPLERLAANAQESLRPPGLPVDAVSERCTASPGLYAFFGGSATWARLGLGDPPEDRPLYVGKAEDTLASRDLLGHFGMRRRGKQSPTGSSTLRRSLAALLADERGYTGVPRNPENPSHFSNFGLSISDDEDLSRWMRQHLRLSLWPHPDSGALGSIETLVLQELLPPLNLTKITTPWTSHVKSARKKLAAQAQALAIS
jgi:hypothetical protein